MARKITTSTDKYGRTVYKITGTKKYAFSLVKAKKIAASLDGGAVRKPAKKTARKATRRPAKRTTAVTRYRGRGGKADSRFKGYDGLEMDEPMTAAERRAVLAAAKAGNRKRKPAKRTTAKRNASGQFVKRTAAKKTTRRNAGRMSEAQLKAAIAKVRARQRAKKGTLTLAQTKAIARTAYFLANGSMNGATAEVNASVKKAGRIGGDLYGYLAQNPNTIVEATDEHPELAAKGYFDDSGYAYEWESH